MNLRILQRCPCVMNFIKIKSGFALCGPQARREAFTSVTSIGLIGNICVQETGI